MHQKCGLCNDSGVILIERKKNMVFYEFANACLCSLGNDFSFLKRADAEELKRLRYARGKHTEMTLEEEKAWLDGIGN